VIDPFLGFGEEIRRRKVAEFKSELRTLRKQEKKFNESY